MVGIGVDDSLGSLGLSEEEPVPPAFSELCSDARKVFADWDAIKQCEARHGLGMIEREPKRYVTSPVMSDQRELIMTKCVHDLDDVARYGALRMRAVV
jgi:hypothetical protein